MSLDHTTGISALPTLVALWAGIVSFAMAALTLVLSGLGLWHSRRVPLDAEIPELRTAQPSLTQGLAV